MLFKFLYFSCTWFFLLIFCLMDFMLRQPCALYVAWTMNVWITFSSHVMLPQDFGNGWWSGLAFLISVRLPVWSFWWCWIWLLGVKEEGNCSFLLFIWLCGLFWRRGTLFSSYLFGERICFWRKILVFILLIGLKIGLIVICLIGPFDECFICQTFCCNVAWASRF